MDTKEAIAAIQKQINEIPILKTYFRLKTKESAKWLLDTHTILEDIFGKNSNTVKAFENVNYEHEGSFEYETGRMEAAKFRLNGVAFRNGLNVAQGVLESAINLLKRKGIEAVYEGKDTPKEASEILKIEAIIDNCLRAAIINIPKREKDIQDALEVLFIGAGLRNEFTREKERIIYSSKTYQPDFVFGKIDTVVEVKFCDNWSRHKEIIGEINDYIIAFRTRYPNLIFIVYDMGIIRDVDEFRCSFEKQGSVIVKVIKQ